MRCRVIVKALPGHQHHLSTKNHHNILYNEPAFSLEPLQEPDEEGNLTSPIEIHSPHTGL